MNKFLILFTFLISLKVYSQNSANLLYDTRDNQVYKTVAIDEQIWMQENINYNYPGSGCYDLLPSNCEIYGRLYTWEMANNVCPDGWHLPSIDEWLQLVAVYGNRNEAGNYLKADTLWKTIAPNSEKSVFNALPGGSVFYSKFDELGREATFFSSDYDYDNDMCRTITLYFSSGIVFELSRDIASVRCVKDSK